LAGPPKKSCFTCWNERLAAKKSKNLFTEKFTATPPKAEPSSCSNQHERGHKCNPFHRKSSGRPNVLSSLSSSLLAEQNWNESLCDHLRAGALQCIKTTISFLPCCIGGISVAAESEKLAVK
jgi:hypothetical protein